MSGPALDFRKVNLNNLVVPPLVRKEKGNLSCTPMYNNPETGESSVLCIQTPVCRIPFGLSHQDQDDGGVKFSVSGSFGTDYKKDGIMKEFYQFCSNIQDYGIHLAAHNSEEWLGERQEPAVCKALMNKWIKVNKDKEKAEKYGPTFKAAVRPKKDTPGQFWATCKDVDGSDIPLSKLENGSKGSMKIKLTSFYVINGKFGFTWDMEWIKLKERPVGQNFDYDPGMYGETPLPPASIVESSDLYADSHSAPTASSSTSVNDNNKREREATSSEAAPSNSGTSSSGQKKIKRVGQ